MDQFQRAVTIYEIQFSQEESNRLFKSAERFKIKRNSEAERYYVEKAKAYLDHACALKEQLFDFDKKLGES